MINLIGIRNLHNIQPIETIPSILEHGILSHNRAKTIKHKSVASPIIQARRENKQIPNGMKLHDYANLYFDAHNPMLCSIKKQNTEIVIIQLDKKILMVKNVVLCDRNASSDYAAFYPVEIGLEKLNFQMIYNRYWTNHKDPILLMEHKSIKCAEALIPNCVPPDYISEIIVYNDSVKTRLESMGITLQITVDSSIFF
ncbi:DUF4433 domain-containing protein [bacterium]|nr:DUF4433 domain-containing protein [bacterium]MBU1064843.1 DUF4433 domain-containing protein [bacterium]MBU1635308.1 DUF4433 domain-containing protein [bacterium]MBU1873309.1 DUF4433 domain-containing protein [bacterium]